VREAAAGALGQIGDTRAVDALAAILNDTLDRDAAFSALVTIGAPCVPALVATLKDDKFSVRTDAAKALGQIGDARAVEPLIATLRDSKEPVREAAAEALDRLGWSPDSGEAEAAYWVAKARWDKCVGDAAVGPLIAVLDDEKVSKSASEVLVRIGAGAVEPLIASLDSTAGAGAVLARIGAPAVEPLIATLQCDGTLSEAAAEALGQIGDVRAVEPLVTALKDKDKSVRKAAAEALGQIADPRALEPLIGTLQDRNAFVRRAAAGALGHLPDPRAVDALAAILNDTLDRDAAFSALVTIGAPCVPALVATLKDDKFSVRTDAAKALGQIGDARAVEPLIATLRDSKEPVREAAAEALDRLGWSPDSGEAEAAYWVAKARWDKCVGDAAVGRLIAVLEDRSDSFSSRPVPWGAVKALGRIADPRAVEPLIAVLEDRSDSFSFDRVREGAAEALGRIGDPRAVDPLIAALHGDLGLRAEAAQALVAMYHSRKLDREAKSKVLAQRDVITKVYVRTEEIHDGLDDWDSKRFGKPPPRPTRTIYVDFPLEDGE